MLHILTGNSTFLAWLGFRSTSAPKKFVKNENLELGGATTTERIDDTMIAGVTEEETTVVADLTATTEVAGLSETIDQTTVAIGIVQNATTTILLSVMNATDAVNQEDMAEAERTAEDSKAANIEVVASRGTTAQAIEKTGIGIALSATMTTLLGEPNATSAVRQKPAVAGDDLHVETTDVLSKIATDVVATEEETTDVVVKFSTTTTGIVHSATTQTLHSVKNATDVAPLEVAARTEGHGETTDVVATEEVATDLVVTIDVVATEEVATDLVVTTDVAVTDVVMTDLVAMTETRMTEHKDDLLDVHHAVKIHAHNKGYPENSVKHAVKVLDTLTTGLLGI